VLVEPQNPNCEQQFPKVDPKHVTVLEQVPSVLTLCATDEVELGPVEVWVVLVPVVDVASFVEEDEELDAPPAFLYQLAGSSPRQVPTETDLNPWEYIEARI
jgi:hypothetical protein